MTTRERQTQAGTPKPEGAAERGVTPGWDEANPFAKASSLPFEAPPFDKIKDSDYQPAIEEGMRRELADVEAIAKTPNRRRLQTRLRRWNGEANC